MQHPIHAITQPGTRWTTERVIGVGFVGVLHVIAIWAILNGLVQKIIPAVISPDLIVDFHDTHQLPPPPPPLPRVDPTDTTHTTVVVPMPTFTIDDPQPPVASRTDPTPPQPPVPDTFVSVIGNTHTIPDYPPFARRLGEQGSVRLDLTISAAGDVTEATVMQSSGYADLDQTAIDWVIAHWKYKPATHGGVAVPSQALAMVVFNLQNAR